MIVFRKVKLILNLGVGCTDGYCQHAGSCVIIMDSPACNCTIGFTGVNCQILSNDSNTITDIKSKIFS
jgi:hypothetical protein